MEKVQYEKNTTWKKKLQREKSLLWERASCKKCSWDEAHDENMKIIQHGKERNYSKCGMEIDHHQKKAKQIKFYMKKVQT